MRFEYNILSAFPSGLREQFQLRRQEGIVATATFQGSRAGRTSPIVVDANINTAAAPSATNKSNNHTGIAKFKTGGRRRGVGGVVGPSQRIKLGRNKNKESNNEGDAAVAVAVPPPLLPSNTEDDVIDKGGSPPTLPSASVTPKKMTSPAPYLYAEIIVPTNRRRPFGRNPSSSAGCAAPAAATTTTTDIDKSESQENVDDVSLSFTSVSSMTGRSSLFGPNTGGIISNRSGGESANNGIMPPPYQNLLSSILWCPFGGDTNDTGGGNQVGTLKEMEVEDYFDYSDMQDKDNCAGDVLKGKGDDVGEFDANEDGGGGMMTMLLRMWNETFNSTCQCFDSMGIAEVEGGGVRSRLGKGVDDGSISKTNGVGSQ